MDFLSAKRAHTHIENLLLTGQSLLTIQDLPELSSIYKGYLAWTNAPVVFGVRVICDIPALLIISLVTVVTYVGIRESKMTSNIMVLIKLAVVLLVIGVGAFYVQPQHWVPFAPNGASGVIRGIAGVFFAYIGFDAISTTAEECKNPQRDLPRGMLYSLLICTVLYVLIALVLTGMVNYKQLAVGDPLAYVFGPEGVNLPLISAIVSFSAIIAMATVLLVYQIGQPRIWMAMSRDGLLPPIFSSIHPRFHTPWFSTLVTGIMVAVPALFMNLTEVTDLTSIGTLFAFVLVCSGVLVLQEKEKSLASIPRAGFRIPYFNSKYIVPALVFIAIMVFLAFNIEEGRNFSFSGQYLYSLLPTSIFLVFACVVAFFCFKRELSLIPVLGLLSCLYLITQLGLTNWLRFGIWLLIGLSLYFAYGNSHSKLHKN